MSTTTTNGDISRRMGRLEGSVSALEEHVRLLRDEKSTDHAEVMTELGKIFARLDEKAGKKQLASHANRIDSLESSRDAELGARERDEHHARRASLYLSGVKVVAGLVFGVLGALAVTGHA